MSKEMVSLLKEAYDQGVKDESHQPWNKFEQWLVERFPAPPESQIVVDNEYANNFIGGFQIEFIPNDWIPTKGKAKCYVHSDDMPKIKDAYDR